ncbi:hypothetical protein C4F17_28385 [Variovorax sp. PMC12]|nr:hypothetical protein C4F17_28385 [Variovorax sp. PMC12]
MLEVRPVRDVGQRLARDARAVPLPALVNGHMLRTIDAHDNLLPQHRFVNDANGTVLYADYTSATDPNTAYNGQRQMVVNGEVLGRYGQTIDQRYPQGNPFIPGADVIKPEVSFSFGYQPIDGNYPAGSPGVYAVQVNDTLQSIAKGAYGDGNLWYLIADANGLMSNADLRAGQVLTIPTRVTSANNVNTFKPYDPSKIANDTPTMLARPQDEKGCGGVGQVIVAVVAVVVAVYTGGAALSAMGATVGTASTGTLVAAGAIGGAVGSIASQAVGIAIGAQDSFSWKGVALGALGGAVSAGIGATGLENAVSNGSTPLLGRVVTLALSNATTQGIAVVTGLQDKFSWKSVAASAVSAGVSQGLNAAMDYYPGQLGVQFDLGKSLISGLGGSLVGQVVRGGRANAATLASDAFGNVIGDSLARGSVSGGAALRQGIDPANPYGYQGSGAGITGTGSASGYSQVASGANPESFDDTWRDESLARMRAQADISPASASSNGSSAMPSMFPEPQLVGGGVDSRGLRYGDWSSSAQTFEVPRGVASGTPVSTMGPLPSPYAPQVPLSGGSSETQYSIGVSGTVFVPLTPLGVPAVGIGGGAGIGVSTDGSLRGTSFFGQVQANGMVGVGAYAGIGLAPGISRSDGPPARGWSTSTAGYFEADAGMGVSGGFGGTIDDNAKISGGTAGIPVRIIPGVGYGAAAGVGVTTSTTYTSRTIGDMLGNLNPQPITGARKP